MRQPQFTEQKDGPLKNNDRPAAHPSAPSTTSVKGGEKRHVSVGQINAIIGSATQAVRSRLHSGQWSGTGTNISYEGATAPGGGGCAGTGQTSGQSGTGTRITGTDAQEAAAAHHHTHNNRHTATHEAQNKRETSSHQDHDDELEGETLGNP